MVGTAILVVMDGLTAAMEVLVAALAMGEVTDAPPAAMMVTEGIVVTDPAPPSANHQRHQVGVDESTPGTRQSAERPWSAPIEVVHRRVWWIREGEGERLVDAGADPQIRV
jgi:hypothetical protein